MKKKKKGMIKMTPNKYQKAALRTESPPALDEGR